jgi:hypothetical protein
MPPIITTGYPSPRLIPPLTGKLITAGPSGVSIEGRGRAGIQRARLFFGAAPFTGVINTLAGIPVYWDTAHR